MTQEERQLLLIDLCARMPYGVKVENTSFSEPQIHTLFGRVSDDEFLMLETYKSVGGEDYRRVIDDVHYTGYLESIKPYLRPMSSMTEEEIEEYRNLSDEVIGSYGPYHHEFTAHCVRLGIKPDNPHECVDGFLNMEAIDWLLANHFDFRGLIPMGIALEALEGMYKTK